VAVEGNIATGKSTFLDIIKAAYPHITVVQEPIAKWTNVTEGEKNSEQKASTEEVGSLPLYRCTRPHTSPVPVLSSPQQPRASSSICQRRLAQ
jgi:hypothetical protein